MRSAESARQVFRLSPCLKESGLVIEISYKARHYSCVRLCHEKPRRLSAIPKENQRGPAQPYSRMPAPAFALARYGALKNRQPSPLKNPPSLNRNIQSSQNDKQNRQRLTERASHRDHGEGQR